MKRIPPLEKANPKVKYSGFLLLGCKVYSPATMEKYKIDRRLSIFPGGVPYNLYMFYGAPTSKFFHNKIPQGYCKLYYLITTKTFRVGYYNIQQHPKTGWEMSITKIELPEMSTIKPIAVKYMKHLLMNIGGRPKC